MCQFPLPEITEYLRQNLLLIVSLGLDYQSAEVIVKEVVEEAKAARSERRVFKGLL